MIKRAQSYFKYALSHTSLIILGLGSGTIFLCNIVFETKLNEVDYGEYSMLITYMATIFNLGLLGLDKVFIRISDHNNDTIYTSKNLMLLCCLVGVCLVITGSYFYSYHFSITTGVFLKIIGISLGMVFGMFIYNVFRIRLQFVWSQITLNIWKFSLGVLALIYVLYNCDKLSSIYLIISIVSVCTVIWFIYILIRTPFHYTNRMESIPKYWLSFAVSIVLFIGLAYFDRYYVNQKFGTEAFGSYFYLANIFLFPFHLLQSYIGFKKVVYFKDFFGWKHFKKQAVIVITQSVFLALAVVSLAYFLNAFGLIRISFEGQSVLIGLFLLLGIIKVYYTLGESAINARISVKLFNKVNLISFIVLVVSLLLASQFVETMAGIAGIMCFVWAALSAIYTFASKQLPSNEVGNSE